MPPGEIDLLDAIVFDPMQPGLYYRVHPQQIGGAAVDPLAPNPFSQARLALTPAVSLGRQRIGMFYAADTPAGALFEALFRNATVYPGRQLYLSRSRLEGYSLSVVHLVKSIDLLPLGLPARKLIVVDPERTKRWLHLMSTPEHSETHAAAGAVAAQLAAAGQLHAGWSWPSLQFPSSTVYLLYDPPLDRAAWVLQETIALDTPAGEAFITDALASAGYAWLADPIGAAYGPGPADAGAL
ncbi:hypothetical protein RHOFW510R12_01205 [Rhodanobacter sp. FW510-R12]|uniref:RES domain-containing protein n=1 Tax=Rhodanobacter thiooxydans TaxID=416169 RepID=UPI00091FCB3D|nr:RES domain-containing protein [Rhodanobacter thiooxydans]UJJ56643.1 RES domain-containing protein [Rhodanobacter thiooxydans]